MPYDGNTVIAEERDLFENESDFITLNDTRTVSIEQHKTMYNEYYFALQDLVDNYNSDNQQVYIENVSKLFKNLVSDDALELYHRIYPEYF